MGRGFESRLRLPFQRVPRGHVRRMTERDPEPEVEAPEESDEGADEEPQPWAKLSSGDAEEA